MLQQADPSCREEKTATASSDPEEQRATPNPLALPGAEGQGKLMCAFLGREKGDTVMDGGVGGEPDEEKETRRTTDDDRGRGSFVATDCKSEGLFKESVMQEESSANSGHACGKAWLHHVRGYTKLGGGVEKGMRRQHGNKEEPGKFIFLFFVVWLGKGSGRSKQEWTQYMVA
ncbi:hypothetical protein NDU88_003542 [Pleurodeles waltl]|uniref:Uncharacterized protein n=1 Tax=Pleurodeles waltl TaxID=8319 RepID=A0AAV7PE48_PLEWA|nr:hypothetical protein NDU88_003542 [Pleurodeles waltl]